MSDTEEQVDIVEQEEVVDDAVFEPVSGTDIKLFGKWEFNNISVSDTSLVVRRNRGSNRKVRFHSRIKEKGIRHLLNPFQLAFVVRVSFQVPGTLMVLLVMLLKLQIVSFDDSTIFYISKVSMKSLY